MRTVPMYPTRIEISGFLPEDAVRSIAGAAIIDGVTLSEGGAPVDTVEEMVEAAAAASQAGLPLILYPSEPGRIPMTGVDDALRDERIEYQAVGEYVANRTAFGALEYNGDFNRYHKFPHKPRAAVYVPAGPRPD